MIYLAGAAGSLITGSHVDPLTRFSFILIWMIDTCIDIE
jgi:hypothetical protein